MMMDDNYQDPTQCDQDVKANMSIKDASKQDLTCCTSLLTCDCLINSCHSHQNESICTPFNNGVECKSPSCSEGWNVLKCSLLSNKSWLSLNPWVWIVVVGLLVAILILGTIIIVTWKKFGNREKFTTQKAGSTYNTRIAFGRHLNLVSQVEVDNDDHTKEHNHHQNHHHHNQKHNQTKLIKEKNSIDYVVRPGKPDSSIIGGFSSIAGGGGGFSRQY